MSLDDAAPPVLLLSAFGVLLPLLPQPVSTSSPAAIPAVSNRRILMVFSFSTASRGLIPTRWTGSPGGSSGRGEAELCLLVLGEVDVRPAGGDDLRAGVERDALGAVDVVLPEERVLPAAEGVVGHRHGDRDVHADHPDAYAALEPPRSLAARGEDRGAVAVRVGVDQV